MTTPSAPPSYVGYRFPAEIISYSTTGGERLQLTKCGGRQWEGEKKAPAVDDGAFWCSPGSARVLCWPQEEHNQATQIPTLLLMDDPTPERLSPERQAQVDRLDEMYVYVYHLTHEAWRAKWRPNEPMR